MLQIKLKNLTPSSRFATRINFFDKVYFNLKKKKTIKKKKFFKKFFNKLVNLCYFNSNPIIISNYNYNISPYCLVFLAKDIYNLEYNWPGISLLVPGNLCFYYLHNFQKPFKNLLGSCFSLINIPYNFSICYLYSFFKKKWTYIKSSGTSGVKLKTKKHIKLILIKLPSQKTTYFSSSCFCFLGNNFNLMLNKQIEGKWGYSFSPTKHINVRGVAKNPVDHPNGGRTKAKKPEKTPWGWVAKHNK